MGRSFFIGEKGPVQWADHVVELPAEGNAAPAKAPKVEKQSKPAPVSAKSTDDAGAKSKASAVEDENTLDLFGRRRGSN